MRTANQWRGQFNSSFLSCEKDMEQIIKKLFIDSRPYSDELKRLMLINTSDCLYDKTNPEYLKTIKDTSVGDMIEQGIIRLAPKIKLGENEEVKTYILIGFDNFSSNDENKYYRDCTVSIDIICNLEYWNIGDYRLRPLKIAGYIDGILNNCKLSGIGTLNFIGASELVLSDYFGGYSLLYSATHGVDDVIPLEE